ncbi:HEAT repeat domain-containing protein [Streptomyces cupreus]|uniref:HEAT repeat domain-containing protein n=1 Tax=Streptomyces cupreus TaxID=2759956 RepID=A0A7X1J8Q5_9ACTN|nr:hypothetical protein [Streptomyces cupreus]MBC2906239.1 hypothetical protein [Streptomyces cupreus]
MRDRLTSTDALVRPSAVAALWAVDGDLAEVLPLLLGLLDDRITFRIGDAADLLGEIGPPAYGVLPRLRDLLTHDYEWVRVPCAAALWEIGGEAEAPAVLDTLLQAMTQNPATGTAITPCRPPPALVQQAQRHTLRHQQSLSRCTQSPTE